MVRGLPARLAKLFALPFLLALACASPTLPLPPPELPSQSVGVDADHITLSGACGSVQNDAVVVVINQGNLVPGDKAVSGAIATGCGQWDASVFAHTGDLLEVTQLAGAQTSPSTTVQVR
jgi:hypothetical protein